MQPLRRPAAGAPGIEAAVALAVGGAYCVQKAVRVARPLLPLAIIPVVFGVQQFLEGWVWTGIEHGEPGLIHAASVSYLVFALFFWPFWIPFSMLLVERSRRTRAFLRVMTGLGLVIGLGLVLPTIFMPGWPAIDVSVHSLHYNIGESPIFQVLPAALWQVLYLAVVSTPLFVSSVQKMLHFGVALVVSAAASHVFFEHSFASVWCFFAAALSLWFCVFFARLPAEG